VAAWEFSGTDREREWSYVAPGYAKTIVMATVYRVPSGRWHWRVWSTKVRYELTGFEPSADLAIAAATEVIKKYEQEH
jgi:hypothetical protein